jgi:hypothetical protein
MNYQHLSFHHILFYKKIASSFSEGNRSDRLPCFPLPATCDPLTVVVRRSFLRPSLYRPAFVRPAFPPDQEISLMSPDLLTCLERLFRTRKSQSKAKISGFFKGFVNNTNGFPWSDPL